MNRDLTLDIAKGLAIVAIAFGHVWRGLYNGGIVVDESMFQSVDRLTYMWHLSVFALTAGLFVERGMRREGAWNYVLHRNAGFLWLYLVWTLLQGVIEILASRFANSPANWTDVLKIWLPTTQLWFLGWLALMLAITAAIKPWCTKSRQFIFLGVVAGISLSTWGLNGDILGSKGLGISIFFGMGLAIGGKRITDWISRIHVYGALAIGAIAMGVAIFLTEIVTSTPPTMSGDFRTPMSVMLGFLASAVAVAACLFLSRVLSKLKIFGFIAYLGRESMTIFLGHVLFQSGLRIVLSAVGVESVVLHLAVGLGGAIVGPLIISWILKRIRIEWIFGSPKWLTRLTMPSNSLA